jgi:hypothetical protein
MKDMEPIDSPAPHLQRPDLPTAPPLQIPLALCAIFVLECLIALLTLWSNYPAYVSLLGLWISVAPWIRWGTLKPRALSWAEGEAGMLRKEERRWSRSGEPSAHSRSTSAPIDT